MRSRAGIAVAIACAAQFLIGVDGLAVAIALPAIQEAFGAGAVEGQWVLTAYGLCFGGGGARRRAGALARRADRGARRAGSGLGGGGPRGTGADRDAARTGPRAHP